MRYDDPELEVDEDDEDENSYEDDDPSIEGDDPNEAPDLVDPDDEDDDANEVLPGDAEAEEAAAEMEDLHPEGPSREVRWVKLGDLALEYRHWKNPRTFTGLDAESIRLLSEDIRRKTVSREDGDQIRLVAGIDDPLKVVRIAVNGGEVQLVLDGQRRHRAAAMMGSEGILIPVLDREPEPVEWSPALARKYLKEVLTVVGLRSDLSAFELSEAAQQLRGERDLDTGKELTIAQIAAAIGRSDSWVSKILTARATASPKLLSRWRKGEISEEQFRDLAAGVPDPEKQEAAAGEIAEQRARGDKAAARRSALEAKEQAKLKAKAEREAAKAAKAAAKADKARAKAEKQKAKKTVKGSGKGKGPAVRGPQADLPMDPKAATPPAPKPKAMSPAIVDDLLDQAARKPPTHEYVKGVLAGIQVATGRIDLEKLPKPWHSYIHHLAGTKPEPRRKRRK